MDVHHAIRVGVHQDRRDDFHVAGEQHQLDVMLLQHGEERPVIGFTAIGLSGERLGIDKEILDPMLSGPVERDGIFFIADDSDDSRLNLIGFDAVDNGLEVGPAA